MMMNDKHFSFLILLCVLAFLCLVNLPFTEAWAQTTSLRVDGTGTVVMGNDSQPQDDVRREKDSLESGGHEIRRPYGRDDLIEKKDFSLPDARQRWQRLTPEQKQGLREKLHRWKNLDPDRRDRIKERFKKFQHLPPHSKEKIYQNWKKIKRLPPSQRREIMAKYKKWQRLPAEKKRLIRERYRRFQNFPAERRQFLQEKRKQWRDIPVERREQLREMYRRGDKSRPWMETEGSAKRKEGRRPRERHQEAGGEPLRQKPRGRIK
jgi:hypothetical protein